MQIAYGTSGIPWVRSLEGVEVLESGIGELKATKSEDELVNAIILGRDGKAVKRTYTKEQMEALRKVIDVMPYLDDEEL